MSEANGTLGGPYDREFVAESDEHLYDAFSVGIDSQSDLGFHSLRSLHPRL